MPFMTETRTKRRTTTRRKRTPETAEPTADIIVPVLRCAACGTMGLAHIDLELSTIMKLNGVEHLLPTCKASGRCTYEAGVLRDKLEFKDTEAMTEAAYDMLRGTDTALDYLRSKFQAANPGKDITHGECLRLLADMVLAQESGRAVDNPVSALPTE